MSQVREQQSVPVVHMEPSVRQHTEDNSLSGKAQIVPAQQIFGIDISHFDESKVQTGGGVTCLSHGTFGGGTTIVEMPEMR